jgi:hypothetical protein
MSTRPSGKIEVRNYSPGGGSTYPIEAAAVPEKRDGDANPLEGTPQAVRIEVETATLGPPLNSGFPDAQPLPDNAWVVPASRSMADARQGRRIRSKRCW